MPLHRFTVATLPATPWKNGGGRTRELACWPPGAGLADFDWRISVADIEQDGPFSAYPGIDRQIVLLEGAGVRLRSADGAIDHRLVPGQPYAFAGEAALQATLAGGASRDFNLMLRRGRAQGTLQALSGEAVLAAAPQGLLLAVQGRWQWAGGALAAGEGLWWNTAADAATGPLLPTTAEALLLQVQLHQQLHPEGTR